MIYMNEKTRHVDVDVMTLGESLPTNITPNPKDLDIMDTCSNCGSNKLLNVNGTHVVCIVCSCVQEGKIIDFKDRAAYDSKQMRERTTQHPMSVLMADKNLGSRIGTGKSSNPLVQKLILSERWLNETNEEREMREVLRIITAIADSGTLNLARKELEDLIIHYRKKFLGSHLSLGRPRYFVILAFVFLELRNTPQREHLSISEFISIINKDSRDESQMRRDLVSAIYHMQKEHGYKLLQPSIDSIIKNVTAKLDLPPFIASKSITIANILVPYYKSKGVKNSGMAIAIIIKSCNKHGIAVQKKELIVAAGGIKSQSTIQNRLKEITSITRKRIDFIDKHLEDLGRERGKVADDRRTRLKNERKALAAFLD